MRGLRPESCPRACRVFPWVKARVGDVVGWSINSQTLESFNEAQSFAKKKECRDFPVAKEIGATLTFLSTKDGSHEYSALSRDAQEGRLGFGFHSSFQLKFRDFSNIYFPSTSLKQRNTMEIWPISAFKTWMLSRSWRCKTMVSLGSTAWTIGRVLYYFVKSKHANLLIQKCNPILLCKKLSSEAHKCRVARFQLIQTLKSMH